jgi:transcriptional regulator with XRE-family HTH domain
LGIAILVLGGIIPPFSQTWFRNSAATQNDHRGLPSAHFCSKRLAFPPGNYLTPVPLAIKDPRRVHFHRILDISTIIFPFGNMAHLIMDSDETAVDRRASEAASGFGSLIRSRRKALKMRQDQLALATGVGRRFLIELEAGKSSCQLGRSLLVAEALGLRPADVLASGGGGPDPSATGPELPDFGEEAEEPDGQSTRILRAAARRHD